VEETKDSRGSSRGSKVNRATKTKAEEVEAEATVTTRIADSTGDQARMITRPGAEIKGPKAANKASLEDTVAVNKASLEDTAMVNKANLEDTVEINRIRDTAEDRTRAKTTVEDNVKAAEINPVATATNPVMEVSTAKPVVADMASPADPNTINRPVAPPVEVKPMILMRTMPFRPAIIMPVVKIPG